MKRSFLLVLALLCACPGKESSIDGGAEQDSGTPPVITDAGTDAGTRDAGITCANDYEVFDPDAGQCVFGPVLDIGACPAYRGLACTVSFPRLSVGEHSDESIALFNTGGAPLTIQPPDLTRVSGSAGAFVLPSSSNNYVIQPGSFLSLTIRYQPPAENLDIGELLIHSNSIWRAERQIPLEGATVDAGCTSNSECLLEEQCDLDAGHCFSCPQPTPPMCSGGNLVQVSNAMGCPYPVCKCPMGEVYRPGTGCVASESCSGSCSDGGSCEDLCCSFPTCLCERDGGVCAQ